MPGSAESLVPLAARNIARLAAGQAGRSVLLICSAEKRALAQAVADALHALQIERQLLQAGSDIAGSHEPLLALARDAAREGTLVLLLQPDQAPFLFELVGRPDQGLKIPADHFWSDWLMRPDGVLRTYGIDMEELSRFRQTLLGALGGAREVRVLSEAGTDITLRPRGWRASHGEVYTAPEEGETNGVVRVDGCAYGGPPVIPFSLRVEQGRVTNLDALDPSDEQQRWVRHDLSRDEGARVLAELGIGISLGARWDEDLMEAEQARGTCHFGFGHNIAYGGMNKSSYHVDLVIRDASILVDGKPLCWAAASSS